MWVRGADPSDAAGFRFAYREHSISWAEERVHLKGCGFCGRGRASASSLLQEGVEVRVARIFNTFGPRMHMNDGRVVSNFILQALQGEPLTVGGQPAGSGTPAQGFVVGGEGAPGGTTQEPQPWMD